MRLRPIALGALTATALVVPVLTAPSPATAAVPYSQIEGTGSDWDGTLVDEWVADVNADGMQVVYTGGGSAKGRRDFALSSVDFAISEIPYQGTDEEGNADTSNGREYAYVPLVAGATAFAYQLEVDGQEISNLRLSGETLARIFTNRITSWADPAITADNNGRRLPAVPITPVVRSDGAGVTAQLTAWLDAEHPSVWRPFLGRAGWTSYFPRAGNAIGRAGSAQVVSQIGGSAGNGSIGYVEYSSALEGGLPVAEVLNESGHYVAPTANNSAIALRAATIAEDGAPVLEGVYDNPDPRAYPLSSFASLIIPTASDDTRMSTGKRRTLADLGYHALCLGQTKAGALGYAPLPLNLVETGIDQLAALAEADPGLDLSGHDVAHCANPTFDHDDLTRDVLDELTPMPESCDRPISGPCGSSPDWASLTGHARVGSTLRARPGSWSGPAPYDYQWYADGRPIGGAASSSYAVPPSLVGHPVAVRVVSHGQAPVAEDTTSPVTIEPGRIALPRPRLNGRPMIGRTLRARVEVPVGTRVRLAWYADEHRIHGAHTHRLHLTKRLAGHRIWVVVVATRSGYTRVATTSRPTAPVKAKVRRTTRTG